MCLSQSSGEAETRTRLGPGWGAPREPNLVAGCWLSLSIPPWVPSPYLWGRGCPQNRMPGRGELCPGWAQRRPATVASLLMACRDQSAAATDAAAPRSSSSSRALSRDAANAPAPQPCSSSPVPPRLRAEPPPAPPRAPPGPRQPAPPSAQPRGRRRLPSRRRGASPAVTQAAVPGNFLLCGDHQASRLAGLRWAGRGTPRSAPGNQASTPLDGRAVRSRPPGWHSREERSSASCVQP